MKVRMSIAAIGVSALVAAGCGSSSSSSSTSSASASSGSKCSVSVGFEGPITGQVAVLGDEQLAFAKLAVADDNKANGTNITLVQGDTQLTPSIATTVTQQMISNSKVVAVVGPAGSQEVEAVGPLFGRAGLAFISGSATKTDADRRVEPDVLPGRLEGQRAGTAGCELRDQDPASEGADDRRRPGGVLDGPGRRHDPRLQGRLGSPSTMSRSARR